jgi:hypothetical protein
LRKSIVRTQTQDQFSPNSGLPIALRMLFRVALTPREAMLRRVGRRLSSVLAFYALCTFTSLSRSDARQRHERRQSVRR